ncbi:MAG TPA: ATP-binding protein [Clostridiales bacterium]|nr:ATP-binding protein [Clostridiales bacterium]
MKFKLQPYLKNYRWQVIFGPILKFLEAVTDLVTPILVALILDKGIPNNDTTYILTLSALIFVMNAVGFIFAIICQKLSAKAAYGIGRDIRRDIYTKITTLSSSEMDKYTTMSFTNRAVNDVAQIQNAIGATIRNVARAPFLLVGSTIMAIIINVKLSLIFAIVIPLIAVLFFLIMKKTNPLFLDAKQNLDNVSNVTRENLSGTRVVRAFNKQNYEIDRFNKANKKYTDVNLKIGTFSALLQPLLSLIVNMSVIVVVWVGGIQVNIGGLTQGQIISFINYLTQISASLIKIARISIIYVRTGASFKRVNDIFELESSVKNKDNAKQLLFESLPQIEFKNVSFSYNGIKDAIKNFSIEIMPGETVGIIGGTGSGKSSLVNLLPRFYDVSKGEILIDGVNIKNYSMETLRNFVSIVPQNPTLFSGTIESNLKFRKKDATDEELTKALIVSQSYGFVNEKPNGIKTNVERGGRNFSGGQRQRLTIARAIVGDPKILILDDSSSALDFQTDYELRKALKTALKNTTKIYVSQRTNSIKQADKIIVLDNGIVCGIGTHDELLNNCDIYKEIYESQNK